MHSSDNPQFARPYVPPQSSTSLPQLTASMENEYWRRNHVSKTYGHPDYGYDQYEPAYRYGWEAYSRRGASGRKFEEIEQELGRGWEHLKGASRLSWMEAKDAVRAAWDRLDRAVPRR